MPKQLLSIIVLSMIFLVSCVDISDPKLPVWETEINLPLKDTVYTFSDQIKTDNNIQVYDSNGVNIYRIASEEYVRYFSVNEYVEGQLDGFYSGYQIPVGTGAETIDIPLSSGAFIEEAEVKSGELTLRLINNSAEEINFRIDIPAMEKDGNVFTTGDQVLPPSGQFEQSYNLTDYTYTPEVGKENQLLISAEQTTSGVSPDPSDLEIEITNSNFRYVKGILPETEIKSIRETIDLPITEDAEDFRNSIIFTNARMNLKAEYLSDETQIFPAQFKDMTLEGKLLSEQTINLTDNGGNANLGTKLIEGGFYEEEFNTQNSNLSEFLSFMPDSVSVLAGIVMNPELPNLERTGIATDQDSIKVTFSIEAFGELLIDSVSIESTEELDIDDDLREELENATKAQLNYIIEHEITSNIVVTADFQNSSSVTLFTKEKTLTAANTNNLNVTSNLIEDNIQLDSDDISNLKDVYFVNLEVLIYTDQRAAWFGPDQKLDLTAWLSVGLKLDLDEDDDNNGEGE